MMNPVSSRLFFALFLLLVLVRPSLAFTHYNTTCTIIGDTDVYGIGVRISYYFSYLAILIAVLANNKRAVSSCVKGLNIISLCILIVLVRNAILGSFAVFEWLVVFPILLLPSSGITFLFSWEASVTCGCFGVIYSVLAGLQPWLYWALLDQGTKEGCDPRYFIFVYFDLYNPTFVRFLKVISIISCVVGFFSFLASAFAIRMGARKSAEELKDMDKKEITIFALVNPFPTIEREMGKTAKERARFSFVFSNLISGATTIAFTEKIISGNDLDLTDADFLSTSQLIPFLVGLFTLISVIFGVWKDRKKKNSRLLLEGNNMNKVSVPP